MNESNLKAHVKKHKVNGTKVVVKGKASGANSVSQNEETLGK